jgi:hypothetical protein
MIPTYNGREERAKARNNGCYRPRYRGHGMAPAPGGFRYFINTSMKKYLHVSIVGPILRHMINPSTSPKWLAQYWPAQSRLVKTEAADDLRDFEHRNKFGLTTRTLMEQAQECLFQ